MPHHLNISTVIDKNQIASDKAFLVLLEVMIKDSDGNDIDTVRLAKNTEDVVFEGETFLASNFEMDMKLDTGKEPQITISINDPTGQIITYVDIYDGLVKSKVRMLIVHEGALDSPAELDEVMLVKSTTTSGYAVSFELGAESSVGHRFPQYRQFKDRCFKTFKGPRCQYAGPDATCDFTRTGVNGCVAKNNEINFGGFPGINNLF
jgi:phage-related protein